MRKALSVWKVILILMASLVGVGGATTLGLYLMGSFKEKVVEPENMSFSHEVSGQGYYNTANNTYELSSDSKLRIVCSTKDVTETKVTLSLLGGYERNGYVSDGIIRVPQTVELNKDFTVELLEQYRESLEQNWIVGGQSQITAKSENTLLTSQTIKVAVDVPVNNLKIKIADTQSSDVEQGVVVGTEFSVIALYTPEESKYFYGDTSREKRGFFSVRGSDISYDENTNKFSANRVTESGSSNTITAYTFVNSYYQKSYFEKNPGATTNDIVEYLQSHQAEAESAYINVKVGSVKVNEVSVALNGTDLLAYVDKQYTITTNSTNGDQNLGVVVKDESGNVLTSLYGKIGIKIPQGLNTLKLTGGRIVVVRNDTLTIEDYNSAVDYFDADEGVSYYLLPNTTPASATNYFWNISSSDEIAGDVQFSLNLFYDDGEGLTNFFDFDDEKSFEIRFEKHDDQAVGWKNEDGIKFQISYNSNGKSIPASVDLSQLLNNIDSENVYTTIKYFVLLDSTTDDTDLTTVFSCASAVEYDKDYYGDALVIDNVSIRDSYELYELNSSILTALRSYSGSMKVIAAIIQTDVDGKIKLDDNGKYVIVKAGWAKEIVIESSLSLANITATYHFDENDVIEKDNVYYIPSVRKDGNVDKTLVYLDLVLTTDDVENDTSKVLNAFNSSEATLKVVCFDEGGQENDHQYVECLSLEVDSQTEDEVVFVGSFYINSSLITPALSDKAVEGVYVALQIQYTDKSATFKNNLWMTDDESWIAGYTKETVPAQPFYIYYQYPDVLTPAYAKDENGFSAGIHNEETGEDEFNPISVGISADGTVDIKWTDDNGEEQQIESVAALQELLKYTIIDQKEQEILISDGVYAIQFAEVKADGSTDVEAGDRILGFNNDNTMLTAFRSTNGNEKTTYMQVYVKKYGGSEIFLRSDIIQFIVKSEGLKSVKYDNSEDCGTHNLVDATSLTEITVTKTNIKKDSKLELSDLFSVFTRSSGEDSVGRSAYTIKFDETFVDSFTNDSSVDLANMISVGKNGESEDIERHPGTTKLSDYKNIDIQRLSFTAPFKEETQFVFRVTDLNNLFNITLTLKLSSGINISNNFASSYTSKYAKYLPTSTVYPNAPSVFAGESYELDRYLSFPEDSGYSWVTADPQIKVEAGKQVGTFVELNNTQIVESITGATIKLKEEIYQSTILRFRVYYQQQSSYAFYVDCTLYVVPNIAIVRESTAFVDLSRVSAKKLSAMYKICKLTDYLANAEAAQQIEGFTFENISATQYLKIDNDDFGFVTTTGSNKPTIDYEIGNEYLQEFRVNVKVGTVTSAVDAIIMDKDTVSNIVVSGVGQTKIPVKIGYYSDDTVEMLENIISNVIVVTYNGKPTVLLEQDGTYPLNGGFSIKSVKAMGYINEKPTTRLTTKIVNYFADEQYAVLTAELGGSVIINVRIDAIITGIGVDFVNYTTTGGAFDDYAILLGNYTDLEDNNIFEEVIAGREYTVLTDKAKTYFKESEEFSLDKFENGEYYYKNGNGECTLISYYFMDGDEYVEATEDYEGHEVYMRVADDEYVLVYNGTDMIPLAFVAAYQSHVFYEVDDVYENKANVGFYVDSSRFRVANTSDTYTRIEIVEDAEGYVRGLAEIDGTKLILHDIANISDYEDVYVVLKLTVFDVSETYSYSYYYRLHIQGNFDVASVSYPYANNAEYLETSSPYYHVAEEGEGVTEGSLYLDKYYEIDFDEEFSNITMANGKKRFAAPIDVETSEEFAGVTTITTIKEVRVNGVVYNGTETTISDKKYISYGSYILVELNEEYMRVYLKNAAAKYTISLTREYKNGENTMIGGNLSYNIAINASADATTTASYSYKASRFDNDEETQKTELTLSGNTFTTDITASAPKVTLKIDEFATRTEAGVVTPITSYEAYVSSNNTEYVDDFETSLNDETGVMTISFTPKTSIAANGSFEIGVYRTNADGTKANISWVAFRIIVNVNSYYSYGILRTNVESGKEYEFEQLFTITDTTEEDEASRDVTTDATVTIENADAAYTESLAYSDLYELTGSAITFAYIEEDIVLNVSVTIGDFTFKFNLTVTASNPYKTTAFDEEEFRYSGVSYTLNIADLASTFKEDVANYTFANGETSDTITPATYAQQDYYTNKNYNIEYSFNGKVIKTYTLVYGYTVKQNVVLSVNYPDPDGTGETTEEYVKTNSSIRFDEKAPFASANRLNIVKQGGYTGDATPTIAIVSSENAGVASYGGGISKLFFVMLTNGAASGNVVFGITVNKVYIEYTVIVVNTDIFTTNINATNYDAVNIDSNTYQAETVYAEDLATYGTKQDLFETDRILNCTFSSSSVSGTTYYIRLKKGSSYHIVEATVKSKNTETNIDMGGSYTGYTYENTYSTLEYAQLGGTAGIINDIYVENEEPSVTSRITFTYKNGREIVGATAKLYTNGNRTSEANTNTYKDLIQENVSTYYINLTKGTQAYRSSSVYNLYMLCEFSATSATTIENETVCDINAGEEVSFFDHFAGFGIVNSRLGVAYNSAVMSNSAGNFALHIYGFADYKVNNDGTTPVPYYYHSLYDITPNAQSGINGDPLSNTYNYITLSAVRYGGTETGKIIDYSVRARGAKNDGDYVMMKIVYTVNVNEETVATKEADLLIKVLPNSKIYFDGTRFSAGSETLTTESGRKLNYNSVGNDTIIASNIDQPIVVEDDWTEGGTSYGNTVRVYATDGSTDSTNNKIVAYLYGNTGTGGNNANTFTYKIGSVYGSDKETINGTTYNDRMQGSVGGAATPISSNFNNGTLRLPNLAIGESYYYIDGQDGFGYKVRLYIKVVGGARPAITLSSNTLTEGNTLAFGADYETLSPETLTIGTDKYQVLDKRVSGSSKEEITINLSSGESALDSKYRWIIKNPGAVYLNTDATNPYFGAIYQTGSTLSTSLKGWKTADANEQLLYNVDGSEYAFVDNTTVAIGVKAGETKIADITAKINGTTNVKIAGDYETEKQSHSPELPTSVTNTVLATVSGISAKAYSNGLGEISKASVTKSVITKFKVTKVEFIYEEKVIKELTYTSDAKTFFTNNEVMFYAGSGTTLVAGEAYDSEKHSIAIPYLDGFYYGTRETLTGVKMRVTLSDGTDEGVVTKNVSIRRAAAPQSLFEDTGVKDNNTIPSSTYSNTINDTLEVELGAKQSVKFYLCEYDERTTSHEWHQIGNVVTLTNNKNYKVTEYVSISRNINKQSLWDGTSYSLSNFTRFKIVMYENPSSRTGKDFTFRYNGHEIDYDGYNGGEYGYYQYDITEIESIADTALRMNIFDPSELGSNMTENSCVTRNLYFIYKETYGADEENNIEGETIEYQYTQSIDVYPQYYTIEPASSTDKDAQGNIEIEAPNCLVVNKGTEKQYYIIPYAEWASKIKAVSKDSTSVTLSTAESRKFFFEVNNDISGGAGAAEIDERGNITTFTSFDIQTNTITLNVYMKTSTVDGNWECETNVLLGQIRLSINKGNLEGAEQTAEGPAGVVSVDGSTGYNVILVGNDKYKWIGSTSQTLSYSKVDEITIGHINLYAEVNNEIILKDVMPSSVYYNNYHFHVVKDEFNENEVYYTTNNTDKWIFTEVGTHTLYVVTSTWNEELSHWTAWYHQVTVYVYNTSTGTEKTIVVPTSETVTFDGVIINSTDTYNGRNSYTFTTSGNYEFEVVNAANSTYTRYHIYVYDASVQAVYYKKAANISFKLNTLKMDGHDFTAYYKVLTGSTFSTASASEVSLTKTNEESSVTSTGDNYYLALDRSGVYVMFHVFYIVVKDTADTAVAYNEIGTNMVAAAKLIAGEQYTQVYKVLDANGKLEAVTTENQEDNLQNAEYVFTNAASSAWYNISFYGYVSAETIDYETTPNTQFALSTLNNEVLEAVGEVETATVTYYKLDTENKLLTERTVTNLEELSEEAVSEQYYVGVTVEDVTTYYLITFNFTLAS